jgi:hypothetical protein
MTTLPWLRLLLFFGLLLPTAALGYRQEMRRDTLPGDTVRVWQSLTTSTQSTRRTDPLALVSLGAALVSQVGVLIRPVNLLLLVTGSVIAVVTGLISYGRIKRRRKFLKGQGWALAGLGMGLSTIVTILGTLLVFGLLMLSFRYR